MRLSASWTGTPPTGCVGARRRRFVAYLLLFLSAVAWVSEAQAVDLTVRVNQPNGNPISFATVCIQGAQAGSRLTDTQGVAVLTLPTGAYTLHVFKGSFQTTSQPVNLSGTQERIVTLQPGASEPPAGVNCQAGAVTTLPPIKITSFEVVDLPADFKVTSPPATQLVLRATFDRKPAFFRIVEDSGYAYTTPLQNLQTVPWQQFIGSSAEFIRLFPLNLARPYGTRIVYLQVATVASEDAASQIRSVSVILTPAQLRPSVLTGAALQGFLDRAQQTGYGPLKLKSFRFTIDPDTAMVNSVCPPGFFTRLSDSPNFGPSPPTRINTLIEKAEFSAFAGPGDPSGSSSGFPPTLMPFWKITNLVVFHQWIHSPHPTDEPATISVSGVPMVNNPSQPPIQAPERTINIERTTRNKKYVACVGVGVVPPEHVSPPPPPVFQSVTVVGPDGRDPREAFPPPPAPSIRISPGTIRIP